jgi:hypothetical protein
MCRAIILQKNKKGILCLKINEMKIGLFVKERIKKIVLEALSISQFIPRIYLSRR